MQKEIWQHYQNEGIENFDRSNERLDSLIRQIRSLVPSGGAIMTIGIGSGYLEKSLKSLGYNVSCMDIVSSSVAAMKEIGFDAKEASIEAIPFEDNKFDMVVASEVLEHVPDTARLAGLQDISRVLKTNGIFLGTVPFNENLEDNKVFCPSCGAHFHKWGHVTSFDNKKLEQELSTAFSKVTTSVRSYAKFKGRSAGGKVKSLMKLALGKIGSSLADPHISFVARN